VLAILVRTLIVGRPCGRWKVTWELSPYFVLSESALKKEIKHERRKKSFPTPLEKHCACACSMPLRARI
jgi:hypothetical protein